MGLARDTGLYWDPTIKCGFCGQWSIWVHKTDHYMECNNAMCPYRLRQGVFARLNPFGKPFRELTFSGNSYYDVNNKLRRIGFMPKRPELMVWAHGREYPKYPVTHYI